MVITHHGGQCFKLAYGDTTVALDPHSKKSKAGSVKFGADVVFVSLNHPNFNGTDEVAYGAKQPFVIDGPGEYEIGEVTARGYGTKTIYENVERFNTIYQIHFEGMNIVFLGALSGEVIDSNILGQFGDIDLLFVPVGGGDVLDAPQASKLAAKLEAKCIIPMHYDDKQLKAFLSEMDTDVKPVEKLTVKQKDLAGMESEVVVLKA